MTTMNPHCKGRQLACVVWALCLTTAVAQAQTGRLNDTGQTSCYNASNVAVACDAATTGNAGTRPHQDGRYGRDAAQAAGALPAKTGGGTESFDFTKIANNGSALHVNATLGTAPTEWACTRDNVTGLVWEVKTNSGLRSSAHSYTWFTYRNDGVGIGSSGRNTCSDTLSAAPYNNQCNTANYVAAVNALGLCGATDWRLPTRRELLSIVHNGTSTAPMIDTTYFPNTQSWLYWSSELYTPDPSGAWAVKLHEGSTFANYLHANIHIRLVRNE